MAMYVNNGDEEQSKTAEIRIKYDQTIIMYLLKFVLDPCVSQCSMSCVQSSLDITSGRRLGSC